MPVNFVVLDEGRGEGLRLPMDAEKLRAMAQRCRELSRLAVNTEVKGQLLEWIDDFETEAKAVETETESKS